MNWKLFVFGALQMLALLALLAFFSALAALLYFYPWRAAITYIVMVVVLSGLLKGAGR